MAGEKFTLKEAIEVAVLSLDSQEEFYNEYCTDWKEEGFDTYELTDILDRFKYTLSNAPFNTADETLLPDMGACTKCPFNTAAVTSLFPEDEDDASCTNAGCFQRKCEAEYADNKVLKM